MTLSEQLETAKKRAEIETLNIGDEKTAGEFGRRISLPPIDLPAGVRAALDPFNHWASKRHARRCPAKPTTVALFTLEQADMGVAIDVTLAQLSAIEAMHDKFALPNPVQTVPVRYALETLIKTAAPRSWSKSEKERWALLPASIRSAITRRENDRDHELRRLQSKVARELELQRMNGADKTVSHEEKVDDHEAQISE
jgi:hypothetical protein